MWSRARAWIGVSVGPVGVSLSGWLHGWLEVFAMVMFLLII
jgi:hypothetical protein